MPFRFLYRTGLRPGCLQSSVISTNDAAYLPGLPLRVPRRWWKVADSNRWLIVAGLPHRYRLFPSLYRGILFF